jgi:hypothetical protein
VHCSATLPIETTEPTIYVLLVRPRTRPARASGGPFFATKRNSAKPAQSRARASGLEGAGDPIKVIEPLVTRDGGTPMKTPAPSGLHPNQGAAVTQGSP